MDVSGLVGIYLGSHTHYTCVRPMASREQGTIEQVSLHETPVSDASRDAMAPLKPHHS